MSICVVVSGGLVEVLQAGPLVTALAEATEKPVLVACPVSAAAVARELSGTGEVLPIAGLGSGAGPAALLRLWFQLRRRRLSVAVVCSEAFSVRAAVYLAGAPRRVGSAGGRGDRLLTDRVPSERGQNRQLVWLDLARPLGVESPSAPHRFAPGAAAAAVAEQLLLSNGVENGRLLVAIAPGAGFADTPVPGWSAERFAHLANRLSSRHGAGVVLIGDARDRAAAEAMRMDLAAETVDLCGELDLATTAAVIARCDLLIAADGPLLHLAAAVGTASVGLFGPTSGRRRAPAGAEHRVVQAISDGTAAGLDRIRVDDVLAGIESTL